MVAGMKDAGFAGIEMPLEFKLMKIGDHIDWDERNDDGSANMAETPVSEPAFERQIDFFATVTLAEGTEKIVKHYMQNIATATKGRHMWAKIEEGFGEAANIFQMRQTSHKDAVQN
eukprot:1553143-Amphidinium_carterae.1